MARADLYHSYALRWRRLHPGAHARLLEPKIHYISARYRGELAEGIAQLEDEKLMALFPPKMKGISWWARTFGCAWWHLTRWGFRSWLIWELQNRPRGEGPFDLVGRKPNLGSPAHASCARPPMADKLWTSTSPLVSPKVFRRKGE